ncbi:hypothetical protein O988_07248, partial [Pseudogymnoascus sp. VKM F-3808]
MDTTKDTNSLPQPKIISMEVDDEDSYESEYRLQIGSQVKYLVITPELKTETLSPFLSPTYLLSNTTLLGQSPTSPAPPPAPSSQPSRLANSQASKLSGILLLFPASTSIKQNSSPRRRVKTLWHPTTISCLDLDKTEQLTAAAYEAVPSPSVASTLTASPVIVKIARFEWETPRLEQETRAYKLLEGSGIAPRFLGHISEGDRVIGFVLEKLVGRAAESQTLRLVK